MTASDRIRSLVNRARAVAVWLVDRVPGLHRFLSELARVEVIERSMVIAGQSLFAATPLLVVVAAFTPDRVNTDVLDELSVLMGLKGAGAIPVEATATADQVRTQTGLIGIVLVVVSALSFSRAMQRMFERVWEQRHLGGLPGTKRCLLWLGGILAYLQLIGLLLSSLNTTSLTVPRFGVQLLTGAVLWTWTSHLLLLGRIPWTSLWPGGLITGIAVSIQVHLSQVLMPAYAAANVKQFGQLGVIFAVSTWLLIFGGAVVVSTVLGRVMVEEPAFQGFFRWADGKWDVHVTGRRSRRAHETNEPEELR